MGDRHTFGGTVLHDLSGYGQNAPISRYNAANNPWSTISKPYAYNIECGRPSTYWQGTSSGIYADVNDNLALRVAQLPLTYSWWMAAVSYGTQTVFGKYTDTTAHKVLGLIRLDGLKLTYYVSTAAGGYQSAQWSSNFPTYDWKFCAAVMRGSYANPVIDLHIGDETETTTLSSGLSTTPADVPFTIGRPARWNNHELFHGWMSDLRVYARAMSTPEVRELRRQTLGGGYGDIVAQSRPIPRAAEAVETTAQSAPIFLATTQAGL